MHKETFEFSSNFSLQSYERAGILMEPRLEKPKIEMLKLRDYQRQAINRLKEHGYNGILNMATGTGKTLTAIYTVYSLWKELNERKEGNVRLNTPSLLCTIIAPGKTLVDQWYNVLANYFLLIARVHSSISYKNEIHEIVSLLLSGEYNLGFIVITSQSFEKLLGDPLFYRYAIKKDRKAKKPSKTNRQREGSLIPFKFALIADEVHHTGAPLIRKQLALITPHYRIGLSATPVRLMDGEGTDFLITYFKGVVFKFSLKDAITRGFLTPYYYHWEVCFLNNEEYSLYRAYSKKINLIKNSIDANITSRSFSNSRKSSQTLRKLEKELSDYLIRRALLIKKAESKLSLYEYYLRRLKQKGLTNRIVVFLEDYEQHSSFLEISKKLGYKVESYDADTPHKRRSLIIKELEEKKIDMVITKRCWDQGIDIPFLQVGILISSTTNPLQYIQRIGRLLRRHPDKKVVYLLDMIVAKPPEKEEHKTLEDLIFPSERNRMDYLMQNALNNRDPKDEHHESLFDL